MRAGRNRGRRVAVGALRLSLPAMLVARRPCRHRNPVVARDVGRAARPIVEKARRPTSMRRRATTRIVPEYKGQYTETMTAALFAIRTGAHPAIVQVNEVATATMMAAKGATYPVYQLMREQGAAFDPSAYLPAVAGYYTDAAGNMLSLPFNASTPILYYNKISSVSRNSIPRRRRAPGRRSRRQRRNFRGPACRAVSPPPGRPGCTSRTCRRCTTCRSPRSRTASAGSTPN